MKLWTNGHFHSMRAPRHAHFNVLTDQGRIVDVDVNEAAYRNIECLDMDGQHVYPGMVDAHLHLVGYGQKLARVDLSALTTKSDVIGRLSASDPNGPFVAEGYRECGVTKDELDRVFKGGPALLIHNDYHSITANSAALEKAGIHSESGRLTEDAAKAVTAAVIIYDKETIKRYFRTSLDALYAVGIVGGHSDDLFYFGDHVKTLEAIREVLVEKPFRTHLLLHHQVYEDVLAGKPGVTADLEFGAVKLFYDGTLSSNTALVSVPYKGGGYGQRMWPPESFRDLMAKIRAAKLTVAVHVIGDQGLDELADVLTAFPPLSGQRDRIIHASLAQEKTLEKLGRLAVILDIQPLFLTSDMPFMNKWFHRKPELLFAWKTYKKHNLVLLGSSDAPVEDPNPLLGIHALVTRRNRKDDQVYTENERLDRFEALKMYTTNHAVISRDPNSRGYVGAGYLADFTVYPEDLLKISEQRLLTLKPSLTVIGEKIVYAAATFKVLP